jgi:hypothetical protein
VEATRLQRCSWFGGLEHNVPNLREVGGACSKRLSTPRDAGAATITNDIDRCPVTLC